MSAPSAPQGPLTLVATPRSKDALVPEQAAIFDLSLQNHDTVPHELATLSGNQTTPVARVHDAAGTLLFEGAPQERSDRVGAQAGEPQLEPTTLAQLAPGAEETSSLDAWGVGGPLGPGRYLFEVEHRGGSAPALVSPRVPFTVTSARVERCTVGYESPGRLATVLAWTATASGKQAPSLFVRLSAFGNHLVPQEGAFDFGPVAAGADLALSQIAPGGRGARLGWVAALGGSTVELIRHNHAHPGWRSGLIALPLGDAQLVPRFPDRGHALLLATGKHAGGAALAGALVVENAPSPPTPWVVALAALPVRAAALFGPTGSVTLLLASDDGSSTRFSRLEVDESGKVVAPEQLVRTSPNRLAGLVADLRPGAPPAFVILETSRTLADRSILVRIPLSDPPPPIVAFAPMAGWPQAHAPGGDRPHSAADLQLEVLYDGTPQMAFTDELGRVFGGRLDGSALSLLRDAPLGHGRCVHLAALRGREATACFDDDGALRPIGAR
jgi:hypothetical protein